MMRTRLIMTPEGAIYKESYNSVRVDLDLHDYFKRQAKAELHFVTPSLGAFGDPADPIVADLRFVMRPEGAPWQTAAIRIPRLNFHTVWEAQDDLLLPTFAQNGVLIDPETARTLRCDIPEFMELWWLIDVPRDPSQRGYGETTMFGILDCPAENRLENPELPPRRTVVLPLPNTYSNAKICTGDLSTDEPAHVSLPAKVTWLYDRWVHAPWNRDLFDSMAARFRALFKWNVEGQFTPANHQSWWEHCRAADLDHHEGAKLFAAKRIEERNA